MKRKDAKKYFEDEDIRNLFQRVLDDLKQAFIADLGSNKEMMKMLRAWLMPEQDKGFGEYDDFNVDIFDPTPENSFERAVSGMLSLHWSPMDEYFRLKERRNLIKGADDGVDIGKALGDRSELIHEIIQSPENFHVKAINARDKLGLALGCKEMDDDEDLIMRFTSFPPEDAALATSNGRIIDVFGKREELNHFQLKRRFPDPIDPRVFEKVRTMKIMDKPTITVNRFNIPLTVFKEMVMGCVEYEGFENLRRDIYKVITSLTGSYSEGKEKGVWVDVWWCDNGLLSVNTDPYRRIIISHMSPPYKIRSFARGQGEKGLPLMLQLSDLTVMAHSGFEKTYTPSWAVENDIEKLGLDLGRDGITFIETGMKGPRPMTLGANLNDAISFAQYKQALYDRIMYMDVFELLNKSRMSVKEVDLRNLEDYSKLLLSFIQDQFDDLNPEVLGINHRIHDLLGKNNDPLSNRVLSARYSSTLAFATRAGVFVKMDKVLETAKKVEATVANQTELSDDIDTVSYYKQNMIRIGEEKVLRTEEESRERKEERKDAAASAKRAELTQSLATVGKTLATANQAGGGGGAPQGAGGGGTQGI